ncbi:MAG: polysaccharide deacetylase family protein [Clostridia bacterium]|nr:polysaccharide deacetylase family protein [Clostridia bacterium]
MKKIAICFLSFLVLISVKGSPAYAEEKSYHWYCVHVKDHVQPCVDPTLAFVQELDGYYIDPKHTDPNADDKVIYLTFDAGYENGNVEKVLDVLQEEAAPGAFFILSNLIEKNPELVKRMEEEGHTVCNHTAHHKNMTLLKHADFSEELALLEEKYLALTGKNIASYYRPPEGCFNRENLVWAKERGYKTVFWSFAYPDWDNQKQMSPERAKKIILENAHNGEVMLLHPTSATNACILRDVIRELKAEGYRFGTLDELTGAGYENALPEE